MGLLDSVLGALNNQQGNQQGGGDPKMALIQAALAMLNNSGGGLGGLLSNLQNAGLGHIADSWTGTGENQPITGDQVQQAVGADKLGELAQAAGLSQVDTAGHLAEILPGLVDKLTPNGKVPEAGSDLTTELGGLLSGLLARK